MLYHFLPCHVRRNRPCLYLTSCIFIVKCYQYAVYVHGLIMYTLPSLEVEGISLTRVFRSRKDFYFSSIGCRDLKGSDLGLCIF